MRNYATGMTFPFAWDYDRRETLADAIVHLLGVALAVCGAAVLIVIALLAMVLNLVVDIVQSRMERWRVVSR